MRLHPQHNWLVSFEKFVKELLSPLNIKRLIGMFLLSSLALARAQSSSSEASDESGFDDETSIIIVSAAVSLPIVCLGLILVGCSVPTLMMCGISMLALGAKCIYDATKDSIERFLNRCPLSIQNGVRDFFQIVTCCFDYEVEIESVTSLASDNSLNSCEAPPSTDIEMTEYPFENPQNEQLSSQDNASDFSSDTEDEFPSVREVSSDTSSSRFLNQYRLNNSFQEVANQWSQPNMARRLSC